MEQNSVGGFIAANALAAVKFGPIPEETMLARYVNSLKPSTFCLLMQIGRMRRLVILRTLDLLVFISSLILLPPLQAPQPFGQGPR